MGDKPRDEVHIVADRVIDGVAYRRCPNCNALKPLDEFGLRRKTGEGHEDEDGVKGDKVTNQSWCRACR